MPTHVAFAVAKALEGPEAGDILVFLPGVEEIRRSARELSSLAAREDLLVLPLHGSLPAEEQDRALRPAGRRKVILATNLAETSLTIGGVGTVIDSGLGRVAVHDASRGLDRLELARISKASAAQRREGREDGAGAMLTALVGARGRGMPDFPTPEVARVDLCETVLALRAWGHLDPSLFPWYEAPPASSLSGAERLLTMLGAVKPDGGPITPLGRQLLALPVHPRLGRLLIGAAAEGLVAEGAALAALLSEKDIFASPGLHVGFSRRPAPEPGPSDLLTRLDALALAERRGFSASLRSSGIDPAPPGRSPSCATTWRGLRGGSPAPGGPSPMDPTKRRCFSSRCWPTPIGCRGVGARAWRRP